MPPAQGRFLGLPYDFRRPTTARLRARAWNREDPRLITPKTWGWGGSINLYGVAHPRRWLRARSK